MLMNILTGHCNNLSERMNMKVYKDNCKAVGIVNGRYRNFFLFSSNEFWNNIGCLVSDPTFGLGG